MSVHVRTPVPGRALDLADVPDPVFAGAMVGPGAAVDPPRRVVDAVAPMDGVLLKVHPHAYIVRSDDGVAVLVHLGIDTVRLDGAHFTVHATAGQAVRAGDIVTTWDVAAVEAAGLNPVVPVIALEQAAGAVRVAGPAELADGEILLTVDVPATAERAT